MGERGSEKTRKHGGKPPHLSSFLQPIHSAVGSCGSSPISAFFKIVFNKLSFTPSVQRAICFNAAKGKETKTGKKRERNNPPSPHPHTQIPLAVSHR